MIICYNDYGTIQKTVESIYDFCDEIICVDGKYSDFTQLYDSDFSADGTLEYLKNVDKVRIIYAANLLEVDKRNKYLEGLKEGDWVFHLDADEVWEGPCEIPLADMGISQLTQLRSGHMDGKRIRLFKYVGQFYADKHYWLKDGQGRTFALLEKPGESYVGVPIEGKIIHHDIDRPPERTMPKRAYYRILMKREGPIREVK